MKTLIKFNLIVISFILTINFNSCNSGSEKSKPRNEKMIKLNNEIVIPLTYLNIDFNTSANTETGIDKLTVFLTNKATFVSYSNVVIELKCYNKKKKMLLRTFSYELIPYDSVIKPNTKRDFTIAEKMPLGTDYFKIKKLIARPVHKSAPSLDEWWKNLDIPESIKDAYSEVGWRLAKRPIGKPK